LLTDGSLFSQLHRPFSYVFHRVRRNIFPPYWKTASAGRREYAVLVST